MTIKQTLGKKQRVSLWSQNIVFQALGNYFKKAYKHNGHHAIQSTLVYVRDIQCFKEVS